MTSRLVSEGICVGANAEQNVAKLADAQIYEIENPPASKIADGGPSDIRAVPAPTIRLVSKPGSRSDQTISLSELAAGRRPYVRGDGNASRRYSSRVFPRIGVNQRS